MFECSVPPPLSDDDIDAALDGAADDKVFQHLKVCPGCNARYQETQILESKMKNSLYRWDCPLPHELGEYALGLAEAPQQVAIAAHLESCPLCQHDLEALQRFSQLAEAKPQHRPIKTVQPIYPSKRIWIAAVRPASVAYAVRGARPKGIVAEVGDITIFLAVEMNGNKLTLKGQVVDSQQDRWLNALLELRQMNEIVGTAVLDEFGEFVCGSLPDGKVNLAITTPDGYQVLLNDVELVE